MNSPRTQAPLAGAPEEDDVALKILHTADWHLGMRFPAFDENDQLKLSRARLDAVDSILGVAETFGVDAVLCAGDLFDQPSPEVEWWQGLVRLFNKRSWQHRPVMLLPGNHDPLTLKSVYDVGHPFRQALPPWVQVVDRKGYTLEISPDAVVYAAPCTSHAGDEDLALSLPAREAGDDRIRIGLAHGQTFDIDGFQTNFPIAQDAAQQRGLDYLAIGDTHSFREVPCAVATVYPGAPEATRFGEAAAGHVAVVCFRRRGPKPLIQQHRIGRWKWRDETCRDLASLKRLSAEPDLATTVLRLKVEMSVSLPEYEEALAILDELKGTAASHGRVGVLQLDRAALRHKEISPAEFPDDLPDILKRTIDRLRDGHSDSDVANRAIYHLYTLVRANGIK